MKELIKKNWSYTFFERDISYILQVMCGSVAMYEITIMLDPNEEIRYKKEGESFIDNLAKDIQTYPSKYTKRNINISGDSIT